MTYLPMNKNSCKIETRKQENFQVNFANTERSKIISMQHLLNTDFKENKRQNLDDENKPNEKI